MSTRPLDAAWTRVNWAAHRLECLKDKVVALDSTVRDPKVRFVTTRGHVDPDGKHWVVRIDAVKSLDPIFGVLAAEIVQHLRSALDYLAFELSFIDSGGVEVDRITTAKGHRVSANIAFPLVTRGDRSWRECGKKFDAECPRNLPGVTTRHRAIIKRHQPYQTWDGEWGHPLTMLSYLDNDNKHRLVQPVFAAPVDYRLGPKFIVTDCKLVHGGVAEVFNIANRPFEPKAVVARFPIKVTGPNPHVNVEAEGDIYIGFSNGHPMLGALGYARDKVSDILNELGPAFETVKAKRVWHPRPGRIEPPSDPPKMHKLKF